MEKNTQNNTDFLNQNRFDRMEAHIKEIQKDIQLLINALTGSILNGNQGMVKDISEVMQEVTNIKVRLTEFEKKQIENSVYISQLKWAVGVICVLVFGYLFNIIFKV